VNLADEGRRTEEQEDNWFSKGLISTVNAGSVVPDKDASSMPMMVDFVETPRSTEKCVECSDDIFNTDPKCSEVIYQCIGTVGGLRNIP